MSFLIQIQDVLYFTQKLCSVSIMNKVLCDSYVINNNYTKINITQILTNSVCKWIISICIVLYYLKFQKFYKF